MTALHPVDELVEQLATLRDADCANQRRALTAGKDFASRAYYSTADRGARRNALSAAAWLLLAVEQIDAAAAEREELAA